MEPNNLQAQNLYRICYRLTNEIYPGWPYKSVELVRVDERTGNVVILAGDDILYEINEIGELS